MFHLRALNEQGVNFIQECDFILEKWEARTVVRAHGWNIRLDYSTRYWDSRLKIAREPLSFELNSSLEIYKRTFTDVQCCLVSQFWGPPMRNAASKRALMKGPPR